MIKLSFTACFLFALSVLIFACNQVQPPKSTAVQPKIVCYQAISNGDTAWLSIDTAQKVINGDLRFNYTTKMQIFDGKFIGKMFGDTLKGQFNFKVNNANPALRNPVAFLKRDKRLTMGVGQFMIVMGSAQFDDRVPIDYERARFVFEETACKE